MRKRKWSEEELRKATGVSTSIRQILIHLGLKEAGGNYAQIKKYLDKFAIPVSHLTGKGWSKGQTGIGKNRIELSDILIANSSFQSFKLKKRLFSAKLKEPRCEKCGWAAVSPDGRLPLELDHINGNNRDNRLENLRILCPNCHSLEPTHRGCNQARYKKIKGQW